MSSRYVRYTGSQEWSALYIDGELDRMGDHYLIDERIAELLGVEVRDGTEGNYFLRGGDGKHRIGSHSNPARTLAEAEEYGRECEDARRRVAELRQQAAELAKRADLIERSTR